MKSKDLRERTTEHLKELEKSLTGEVFQARFKNFTNRLNDTATIRKTRRDLARVKTILTQRTQAETATAGTGENEA
jgi:large subunit ribosomal protein L29